VIAHGGDALRGPSSWTAAAPDDVSHAKGLLSLLPWSSALSVPATARPSPEHSIPSASCEIEQIVGFSRIFDTDSLDGYGASSKSAKILA
jgi:hypothetical protein